ncbi:MAG: 4-carboxy-2-hydroxymuconate-6-semialdehyde dehydrogenase [Candidatus Dependentiae bacterium ADurb.Bin331]|nr:MAG: 4-carboxy-2-hydroxymuconate-6-semialdehyde dehydrogenase [Candidatus Dependentiae bacterium ADurb.Bin331]
MRQVFLDQGVVTLKEVCEPVLDDHLVMVQVHYSCISPGTENATIAGSTKKNMLLSNIPFKVAKVLQSIATHGIQGTKALIRERLQGNLQALGYSCSGKVIAVGKKITKFRSGDYVACAGAGLANHADIVCVPENLVAAVSDPDLLQQASYTTLGAIALQGVRRAQPQLGDYVAVVGLGLLGQITVQLLKNAGCVVIGVDLVQERLELAQKFGADYIFNSADQTIGLEIAALTGHYGVDCTLLTAATSSNELVQQAMEITRKKGKVVVVGDVGLGLERAPLYEKEIDFLISCSYGPGRYDANYEKQGIDYPYAYVRWTENRNMQAFVSLLATKKITMEPLINAVLPVQEAINGYELLREKKAIGVVIDFVSSASQIEKEAVVNEQLSVPTEMQEIKFIPAVKDTLRVGVIGAGGFAKIKLLPFIARMKNVKINAVVEPNVAASMNISNLYQAQGSFNHENYLFEQDLVDAVVIASPHKFHCEQAMQALERGKAVFLEKPMVTDFEQLERMYDFLKKHQQIPFCVDYNRSFAPFMQKIKKAITQRRSPLVVHYRMNAGFIPKDHWVQTEVGAGRIIGEACHIFDLFCYLTNSFPVAVSVESIKPSTDDLFPTDNFSAQFSFADGSVCTLLYTALGHAQLGKERMELYFDSKAIVMDDFKTLTGYGLSRSFDQKTNNPDKGHEFLLGQFFAQLKKETFTPPIDIERLYKVAHITLVVDQLACAGGGNKEFTI